MTPETPRTPRPYGVTPAGFQLPDAARPGSVRLLVADLERSVRFYERLIGLRVTEASTDKAALAPADADQVLVHLHARPGIRPVPRRGRFGLFHFAILLPDRAALGRAAAHLLEHGVIGGMADHLVSEALYLSDPDGLGIEVYADRPSSAWSRRGRELVMATEPLDIDGVIAAGEKVPWSGAPAGTRIGHVHLHVGTLREAEAFYHSALGFDKTTWSYPGALFLSAGGYHHHLGTNTWSPGPSPAPDEAQLIDWELLIPGEAAAGAVTASLVSAGYAVEDTAEGFVSADPWGTRVRIVSEPG